MSWKSAKTLADFRKKPLLWVAIGYLCSASAMFSHDLRRGTISRTPTAFATSIQVNSASFFNSDLLKFLSYSFLNLLCIFGRFSCNQVTILKRLNIGYFYISLLYQDLGDIFGYIFPAKNLIFNLFLNEYQSITVKTSRFRNVFLLTFICPTKHYMAHVVISYIQHFDLFFQVVYFQGHSVSFVRLDSHNFSHHLHIIS